MRTYTYVQTFTYVCIACSRMSHNLRGFNFSPKLIPLDNSHPKVVLASDIGSRGYVADRS